MSQSHSAGFKKFILVTGAAGQVGSCLVDKLIENEENFVVAVDNYLTGTKENLPKNSPVNYKFIVCDVNDKKQISAVMTSFLFDYVFHYAAVVGVKRTIDNPLWVLNDINGIEAILKLCVSTGVKRIFFSSSSEVYGEPFEHPQNEHTTPLNSRLPYAIVKNVAEAYLRSYHKEYGLDYTIFRFFNTYGPKQSKDFVVKKFLNAALNNEPITIFGDGSQSRTLCYIADNIDATTNCLYKDLFVNETINIGNSNEISMLELAKFIRQKTNSKSEIIHLPALEEGDMTRRCPDIANMKTALDRELTDLETGIDSLIRAMKS
ncbi:MAG: NAD-dependent epimerase/dehydratase family protein [Chitinophagales bacterium]|jgi:nucleoside-diphosphate-sugar epimerase|nr:NAD-dependent epimerase/dehydratase family protein [Sphingobacteriales bacterium]